MNYLDQYYKTVIKKDLLNKFQYNSTNEIPSLKKITLNFGIKKPDLEGLACSSLFLRLITGKKNTLTYTKKPNILLKIRKGNPVGCKVTIKSLKMYDFLMRFLIRILPKLKDFNKINIKKQKFSSLSFTIKENDLKSIEMEDYYYLITHRITDLNITINTETKTHKEFLFLVNSLKLTIHKNQDKLLSGLKR